MWRDSFHIFCTIVIFLGMVVAVIAQNGEPESQQPAEWDWFRTKIQTRLGKVPFGEIPDTVEFDHPRFYNDFKIGRFNTWLMFDPNAPNARFRQIPEQQSPQSQPSSNILSAEKTNKRIVSANTPVQADTSTNFPPQPVRRLPGFFERSGIMEATALSEENSVRSSSGSRWFRDFGRNDRSGVSSLVPRSQQNFGENNNDFNGNAIPVGGELLQTPPATSQPIQPQTQQPTTSQSSMSATKNQAATLRHFEQKLEGMLLSHPSIHFLSPVQISFHNGIVVVRGVVADQKHKIAAGNFLLTDP
ncbi:MAG: hypothetical protein LBI18_15000, partial [Planctomycetaceae bacterium]|nr:hypothetical protein [Planctomycetaceae bacterium]